MSVIRFAKFHALGNDFCVVKEPRSRGPWTRARVERFCDRHRGVGADGLVVLGKPISEGVPMRLFNADGSKAEWSGNGVRCAAASLVGRKRRVEVRLLTAAGTIDLNVVCRGPGKCLASFERPMPKLKTVAKRGRSLVSHKIKGPFYVDAGNPHWIFLVPNFEFPWDVIGHAAQKIEPRTHGVNVEFVQVINRRRIEMRIYERGVGPTQSSGSGALAAVAVCANQHLIDYPVRVISPGGEQLAEWIHATRALRLTAVTHHVFSGQWESA